jgi:general secretion pathway protein A
MYEAFYGLREKPFNLTPDPKYLYLSDKHKEAFAHLLFGIKNRSGFVMVTGEIGTGKTTICRNLLNQLDPNTEIAFVFNPSLNPNELLRRIVDEFGIETPADNSLALMDALNDYLLKAAAAGKNCVLLIDEAQNLSPQVLEQIRLLSNLETESEKLLQIILIGQPELLDKLSLRELRQLNQRITARYHLKPLDEKETLQYIAYRLHVAGGRKKVQFAKKSIRLIYKHSGGTPRVINALCDRALLIGYTKEAHVISPAIVKRAAREIRGERPPLRRRLARVMRAWAPSPTMLAVVVMVLLLLNFMAPPLERVSRELGIFNTLLRGEIPEPSPGTATTVSARTEDAQQQAEQVLKILSESPFARTVLGRIPAPEEPDTSVADRLAAVEAAASRQAAATALLRAWNLALVGAYPESDELGALTAFAEQNGLAYEWLTPAAAQLTALNLPAFVRLNVNGQSRWAGLMGLADNRLRITSGMGESLELSPEQFRDLYAGEAVVLWKDPQPGTPVMAPGAGGRPVAQLKEKLRLLGRLSADNTSDRYDGPTASAVARLQAETGLTIDGIAGKQVRMVLSSWLPSPGTPNLQQATAAWTEPIAATQTAPPLTRQARTPVAQSPPPAPVVEERPETPPPLEEPEAATPEAPEIAEEPEAASPEMPEIAEEPEVRPEEPEETLVEADLPESSASDETEPEESALPVFPPLAPAPRAFEEANDESASSGPGTPQVQVRDLPENPPPAQLPPLETDEMKESTPPAAVSPLVPRPRGRAEETDAAEDGA